jgi:hypothetical protein
MRIGKRSLWQRLSIRKKISGSTPKNADSVSHPLKQTVMFSLPDSSQKDKSQSFSESMQKLPLSVKLRGIIDIPVFSTAHGFAVS